jgi:hypothetical protein
MIVVAPNLSSKCSRLVRSSALSRLEGESREEPTRLASLELRLEELLSLLLRRNLLGGVVQSIRGDDVLEVVGDVEGVARRHEVRVVDVLDERLALGALGLLLVRHLLGHLCVRNDETSAKG